MDAPILGRVMLEKGEGGLLSEGLPGGEKVMR
jgi:hypothetical protein